MNNCPECGNATHCTRATKDLQKEFDLLMINAKELQSDCLRMKKEIDEARALLAEYSSSPIAKDRTLVDALRNMLAAYVTNRDCIVKIESDLKHLQKRWDEAACPECHDFGCGGHR